MAGSYKGDLLWSAGIKCRTAGRKIWRYTWDFGLMSHGRRWKQMKLCVPLYAKKPEYRDTYETIYNKIKIKVLPATPRVEEDPAVNIQYGQSLKDAVISGGR